MANGGGGVVGKQDVGKRVIVGKVGTGMLRYVGPVQGKEGLFCGVELDLPQGRHNGTYQALAIENPGEDKVLP
uniref:CAP-Gly domain-containing protein n=1 Tax=Ascaris lumbricoides TaxID=6252 RepID=A0A0M3IAI8_ASCLU